MTAKDFDVGGVRFARPFRVRRLGHFGINVHDTQVSREFYEGLLGFQISDIRDFSGRIPDEKMKGLGSPIGYFSRHSTEHHSFVFFPRRVIEAVYGFPADFPEIVTNQITWQVGSLREVVDGYEWFKGKGTRIQRSGRDLPGSNWNVYPFDPDGHVNELFYAIEQIGWQGHSKPAAMHETAWTEPPPLPHRSEYSEVRRAIERGVNPAGGWRATEPREETHDVGGVLLGRPFKVVKVGPVRLFVKDMEVSLRFYRDDLGLAVTEEVVYEGHRCVFLRANTDHHAIALYPIALREVLGLHPRSTLFSFGLQIAEYSQLRDALPWLRGQGAEIRHLPPELFPGVDASAFVLDPDGLAIQLYWGMEQVGWDGVARPAHLRRHLVAGAWPETLEPLSDSYMGEAFIGPWN